MTRSWILSVACIVLFSTSPAAAADLSGFVGVYEKVSGPSDAHLFIEASIQPPKGPGGVAALYLYGRFEGLETCRYLDFYEAESRSFKQGPHMDLHLIISRGVKIVATEREVSVSQWKRGSILGIAPPHFLAPKCRSESSAVIQEDGTLRVRETRQGHAIGLGSCDPVDFDATYRRLPDEALICPAE